MTLFHFFYQSNSGRLIHWQARLSPTGVAGAILKVYNSLS
jgi:hypothetical protein